MQSFGSLRAWLVFLLALSLTAVAQRPEPVSTAPATSTAMPEAAVDDVRLGPGDLVDISVFNVNDLHQEARISSSGDVSLPLIGSVRLGGLTGAQAEWVISKALVSKGFLTNPQVNVFIKEYNAQGISVFGEVNKPGIYPPVGSRRLFDVISGAGGMTEKAGRFITITRRGGDNPINVMVPQNPSDLANNNVKVFPGDTVQVSKAGIVYVVGDVARPGGFVMDNGDRMTVLQAIAMAQGTNPTAALGHARLIHRNVDGKRVEVPVALANILHSKADDIDMQSEDVLFVPSSAGKSAARRGLESVISIATGVAIYHH